MVASYPVGAKRNRDKVRLALAASELAVAQFVVPRVQPRNVRRTFRGVAI